MDNNNRKKILIITVAVIAGLLIGEAAIYAPLVASWHSREEQIQKLKDDVRRDTALMHRKPEIMDRWQLMQDNALTNDLSQAQSALVKAVDNWARSSGVTTESIQPQVRSDPDENNANVTITTVECRVDATGTMSSLLGFLYRIGQEKMGTKLDNVELATKDTTGEQLSMGLTISALVLGVEQPDNNAAPAPTTSESQ